MSQFCSHPDVPDARCPPTAPLPVHAGDTGFAGSSSPVDRADPRAWDGAIDLYRRGEYEAAAQAFREIARAGFACSSSSAGPRRHRALVAQASAVMRLGRFREAIDLLDRALADDPSDPIVSMNLATAQYRAGFLPQALTQACASAELFRTAGLPISRPRHLQGLIQLESGRIDRAARLFEDALEAEPGFVPALLGLSQCCAARDDRRGAERHLHQARRLVGRAPEDVREVFAAAVESAARSLGLSGADSTGKGGGPRWLRWMRRLKTNRRERALPYGD